MFNSYANDVRIHSAFMQYTAGLTQSAHGADDDANSSAYYKYVPTLISVTDIN
jgi:hypothetical protein